MENSKKTWLALAFGLLAGGAAGVYLTSEEGKRMRKKVSADLKNAAESTKENLQVQSAEWSAKLQDAAESAQGYVQELAETTKQYTEEISSKAKGVIANTSEELEEGADSFNKGVNKAKRNINRKLAKVSAVSK